MPLSIRRLASSSPRLCGRSTTMGLLMMVLSSGRRSGMWCGGHSAARIFALHNLPFELSRACNILSRRQRSGCRNTGDHQMNRLSRAALMTSLSSFAILAAAPAAAQNAAAPPTQQNPQGDAAAAQQGLDDPNAIVVTGTRRTDRTLAD